MRQSPVGHRKPDKPTLNDGFQYATEPRSEARALPAEDSQGHPQPGTATPPERRRHAARTSGPYGTRGSMAVKGTKSKYTETTAELHQEIRNNNKRSGKIQRLTIKGHFQMTHRLKKSRGKLGKYESARGGLGRRRHWKYGSIRAQRLRDGHSGHRASPLLATGLGSLALSASSQAAPVSLPVAGSPGAREPSISWRNAETKIKFKSGHEAAASPAPTPRAGMPELVPLQNRTP